MLRHLPRSPHTDVLVGIDTSDDAGVYRLTADMALVQTVDFFTPVVDDPWTFGAIAAANALSDIYAMGATPLTALNLLTYPQGVLSDSVVEDILRGGAEILRLAGAALLGGHTLDDPEPKFGMAVTGLVHPDHIATNAGGKVGDMLVLTKPLGSGIITTALKNGLVDASVATVVSEIMMELNAGAAAAMREIGIPHTVHAATDVTGFGLLGHLHEMAVASGVAVELDSSAVPMLAAVPDLVRAGAVPGGSQRNRDALTDYVVFGPDVPSVMQIVLADAQTSGGLLIAVSAESTGQLLAALQRHGVEYRSVIGRLIAGRTGSIVVR